jgi:hypothetical protein
LLRAARLVRSGCCTLWSPHVSSRPADPNRRVLRRPDTLEAAEHADFRRQRCTLRAKERKSGDVWKI